VNLIYFQTFFQDHLLSIIVVFVTLILLYHYVVEREMGVNLSKKYRNSIYEVQSRIFLNATQFLISGEKDLAIKEFLSAVDLNRETLETYFALGGLFRSNGEIDKAISIHRSLIARDNITESSRLRALKELAIDFDKGGFLDKAIDTYKDVLKINRDQPEVILALCRIYEDVQDWDQAYNYRMMLSKVAHENQAETISHILIEKAKLAFESGDFKLAQDEMDNAFKFAPSLSAKILRLKLSLIQGLIDESKALLIEIVQQHPMYTSFALLSLEELPKVESKEVSLYQERLELIKEFFLNKSDLLNIQSPSIILSQIRLLKDKKKIHLAFDNLSHWMSKNPEQSEILKAEYINLLIEVGEKDKAIEMTLSLLKNLKGSLTRHYCSHCGFNSDDIFWRCPQCYNWETIQFRWKI
jgi:lipopolysaccharide biosynthesis regulator YciM